MCFTWSPCCRLRKCVDTLIIPALLSFIHDNAQIIPEYRTVGKFCGSNFFMIWGAQTILWVYIFVAYLL